MAVQFCSISGLSKIPQNFRLVAINFAGERHEFVNPFEALKYFCESQIRKGRLTWEVARRLNFSWLASFGNRMTQPVRLEGGIFLEREGTGNTQLVRLHLLCKKFNLPSNLYTVEYETLNHPEKPQGRNAAILFLEKWNDKTREPDRLIQQRIHELSENVLADYLPYKIGIGDKRFVADSWASVANALIAYIYIFYPNGPERLSQIQNAPAWTHQMLVEESAGQQEPFNVLPVPEEVDPVEIKKLLMDLMWASEWDRYSFFVKCTPNSAPPKPRPNPVPTIPPQPTPDTKPTTGPLISPPVSEVEPVVMSRHFRPRFTMD